MKEKLWRKQTGVIGPSKQGSDSQWGMGQVGLRNSKYEGPLWYPFPGTQGSDKVQHCQHHIVECSNKGTIHLS